MPPESVVLRKATYARMVLHSVEMVQPAMVKLALGGGSSYAAGRKAQGLVGG